MVNFLWNVYPGNVLIIKSYFIIKKKLYIFWKAYISEIVFQTHTKLGRTCFHPNLVLLLKLDAQKANKWRRVLDDTATFPVLNASNVPLTEVNTSLLFKGLNEFFTKVETKGTRLPTKSSAKIRQMTLLWPCICLEKSSFPMYMFCWFCLSKCQIYFPFPHLYQFWIFVKNVFDYDISLLNFVEYFTMNDCYS